ncbi:MAG: serine hydrolase [Planctomycetes bacterium]|nr:serine hydrolase [Planctomycetota bacterium]MCH9775326.1 serine hydrolase [Planctomycetota bacterium]
MPYRLHLFMGLLLISSPILAADIEIQLKSSAAACQRHLTRLAKEGYTLSDISVYQGKRNSQFAAIAIKQPEQKEWKAHLNLNSQQLATKLKQYARNGFQPVVISGSDQKGTSRFTVIWHKIDHADHIVRHSLSNEELQTELLELQEKGYTPLKLDGYTLKGQVRHAGIWSKRNDITWETICNITFENMQNSFDDFSSRGFRLADLCGFVINGKPYFHAIWHKEIDSTWISRFHMTESDYKKASQQMAADKYQISNIDGYRVNNNTYFATIWQKEKDQKRFNPPTRKTIADILVSGRYQKELASLDDSIKKFLLKHNAPGAAVAVSFHGRLVYARGFGYADLEQKQPVQPDSLFRIASISKPISAVAIMTLVEQKKLNLNTKVFDILKEYRNQLTQKNVDPRLKEITIGQLLHHSGGWDRTASFDPMFRSVYFAKQLGKTPPAETNDIIRMMMKQPLDFNPGERFAYSNFGYCLLGRVIEEVTGQSYEKYVQEKVFMPLDISNIQLGKTRLKDRKKNEVKYYSPLVGSSVFSEKALQRVSHPYGVWCLEAMDSHGGWIASAPDLVRFATAFNQPDKCPILKAPAISQMFERPTGLAGLDFNGNPRDTYYACGWMVNPIDTAGNANHWHAGSLEGTSALLVRHYDRINWAILFNTRRGKDQKRLSSLIDGPMHQWINQIEKWPVENQFKHDESESR